MKNTAALIDANVLLNYITNREDPFLAASVKTVELCARGWYRGYIAFHTLSSLWYVLRKRPASERREILRDICAVFTVVSASHEEILDAIEKDAFRDFEDCLQDKCAREAGADYIVTCNVRDYAASEVQAVDPALFLMILSAPSF